MVGFEDLIATGMGLGIFDLFLPFVLSWAIIYGIMRKVSIFGDEKVGRTTDLIVSIVLSLLIIGYTPVGITLAAFFGTMFTGTVMIVVTLLGTIMVLYVLGKMLGIDIISERESKRWKAVVLILAIVLAAAAFLYSGGLSFFGGVGIPGIGTSISLPALPSLNISLEDAVVFGSIVLVLAVIIYISSEEGGKDKGGK